MGPALGPEAARSSTTIGCGPVAKVADTKDSPHKADASLCPLRRTLNSAAMDDLSCSAGIAIGGREQSR